MVRPVPLLKGEKSERERECHSRGDPPPSSPSNPPPHSSPSLLHIPLPPSDCSPCHQGSPRSLSRWSARRESRSVKVGDWWLLLYRIVLRVWNLARILVTMKHHCPPLIHTLLPSTVTTPYHTDNWTLNTDTQITSESLGVNEWEEK